jgi:hypothetical protein
MNAIREVLVLPILARLTLFDDLVEMVFFRTDRPDMSHSH